MCERDPRCKAFVEIEGLAYLKSCANPDRDANRGRTLYVYHTYYKDLPETPNPPNLRKSLPKIDSSTKNHSSTTSPSLSSNVPALGKALIGQDLNIKTRVKDERRTPPTQQQVGMQPFPVQQQVRMASVIKEKHHDEWALSVAHRLQRFKHGPALKEDDLKRVLLDVLKHVSDVMQSCDTEHIIWGGTLLGYVIFVHSHLFNTFILCIHIHIVTLYL